MIMKIKYTLIAITSLALLLLLVMIWTRCPRNDVTSKQKKKPTS